MLTLSELEERVEGDEHYESVFGDEPSLIERKKCLMRETLHTFKQSFGVDRDEEVFTYFVPGRVEILGKHTDYAGGHSLLIAIDRGFHSVSRLNSKGKIRIFEIDPAYGSREFPFSGDAAPVIGDWSNYPVTMANRLFNNFSAHLKLEGVDIAFGCDLPPAGGMSGSSALMIMTFFAIAGPNGLLQDRFFLRNINDNIDLAMYLACVENGQTFRELAGGRGVGTFGGSEDHTEILNGKRGMFSIFQFCPTVHKADITYPEDLVTIVAHSGVKAEKTRAAMEEYNLASRRADLAVRKYNERHGTDHKLMRDIITENEGLSPERLMAKVADATSGYTEGGRDLDLPGRFKQFYDEDHKIIPNAARALIARDFKELGEIIDESHNASKRHLWNIVPEIDFLQKSARELGAIAASGFGAGFGGSAYAMITKGWERGFMTKWGEAYKAKFPQHEHACRFSIVFPSEKATEMFV